MKKNNTIYIFLVILVLVTIIGCSGSSVKTVENECVSVVNDYEKHNCYLRDLRYNISSQIESDLTTWFKFNYPNGNSFLDDATVAVNLTKSGEINELRLLQSSGDASFDNALLQAIKNASPFELPKEEKIRARLQEFSWTIHF